MPHIKLFALVFGLAGVLILLGAVFFAQNALSLLNDGVRTTGVIDRFETHYDDGTLMYSAVYHYDVSGVRYEVQSNSSTSWKPGNEGDPVEIIYDPDAPESGTTNSLAGLWLPALIMGALGSIFSLLGIGFLIFHRRVARVLQDGVPVNTRDWEVFKRGNRGGNFRIVAGFDYNGQRYSSKETWISARRSVLLRNGQEVIVKVPSDNPGKALVDIEMSLRQAGVMEG